MHSDECLHVYVLCAHAFSTQYTASIFAVYLGIFQYLLGIFWCISVDIMHLVLHMHCRIRCSTVTKCLEHWADCGTSIGPQCALFAGCLGAF